MSDDFLAQQQANSARNDAYAAQRLASDAQHDAFMANKAAKAAKEAADQAAYNGMRLEHQVAAISQENAELKRTILESEAKREAMAAIPFCREELASRFANDGAERKVALEWLTGDPFLLANLSSTQNVGTGKTWLGFATEYSVAMDKGETAHAAESREKLRKLGSIDGLAWLVLDAMKRSEFPENEDLLALLAALPKSVELPRAISIILCNCVNGRFGELLVERTKGVASSWATQLPEMTTEAVVKFIIDYYSSPIPSSETNSGKDDFEDQASARFRTTVLEAAAKLRSLAAPVDKNLESLSKFKPIDMLIELSQRVPDVERELRTRLFYYENLITSGSSSTQANKGKLELDQKLSGPTFLAAKTLNWLCAYGGADTIVKNLLPKISHAVNKILDDPLLTPQSITANVRKGESTIQGLERIWRAKNFETIRRQEDRSHFNEWKKIKSVERKSIFNKRFIKVLYLSGPVMVVAYVFGSAFEIVPHPIRALYRAFSYPDYFQLAHLLEVSLYTLIPTWLIARSLTKRKYVTVSYADDGHKYIPIDENEKKRWESAIARNENILKLHAELPLIARNAIERFSMLT